MIIADKEISQNLVFSILLVFLAWTDGGDVLLFVKIENPYMDKSSTAGREGNHGNSLMLTMVAAAGVPGSQRQAPRRRDCTVGGCCVG